MGRLEQIEKRDRFVTLTTPRHKDSFTAEDSEWLIARLREAKVLSGRLANLDPLNVGSSALLAIKESHREFLANLEAPDA